MELKESGGTIYIDIPIINMIEPTQLSISEELPGGIIGVRLPNGEYPIINFPKLDRYELFGGKIIYGSINL